MFTESIMQSASSWIIPINWLQLKWICEIQLCAIFFAGKLFLSPLNGCLQPHPFLFFLTLFLLLSRTTVYSRVTHKCLPLAFYDTVCECVRLCMLMCAAKFHFQFRCVYPADSLQSVDKEPAMTARANVAKLRARLTEKVKLMSVNPEQLSIRGQICRETYGWVLKCE